MGEMVVSATASEELIALGLGSCIGLAVVDRVAAVAGLAHVVLPESHGEAAGQPGKFADTAVPELLERMRRAGAMERRLEIALVGGARMFEMSGGLDIGARNEEAVRAALGAVRLKPAVVETGGNQGRTVRIQVGAGEISMRVAGQSGVTLIRGTAGARSATGAPRGQGTGGTSGTGTAPGARPARPATTRLSAGDHAGGRPARIARPGRQAGGPRGRASLSVGGAS